MLDFRIKSTIFKCGIASFTEVRYLYTPLLHVTCFRIYIFGYKDNGTVDPNKQRTQIIFLSCWDFFLGRCSMDFVCKCCGSDEWDYV